MMLSRIDRHLLFVLLCLTIGASGCNSLTWTGTHAGVRYSIQRDKHTHHIVKGKDGSLMYDSPELIVLCEAGRLVINGESCGTVSEGDLVEITDLGTVLVNGQRRGDRLTGNEKLQSRLQAARTQVRTHTQAELDTVSRSTTFE